MDFWSSEVTRARETTVVTYEIEQKYQKYVYAATPRPREWFENANICILPTFQESREPP